MILTLGEEHYHPWGELLRGIRIGEPAFNHLFGEFNGRVDGLYERRAPSGLPGPRASEANL
jgi:hypothetical protein